MIRSRYCNEHGVLWAVARTRSCCYQASFCGYSKEAHQAIAGLACVAGRGVLQVWLMAERWPKAPLCVAVAHGRCSTQHTLTARPLLATCWVRGVLSISCCSSFPLSIRHLVFAVHIRRRLSLSYATAGDIGDTAYLEAAHLELPDSALLLRRASYLSLLLYVQQRNLWSSCHWEPIILVNTCKLPRRWP